MRSEAGSGLVEQVIEALRSEFYYHLQQPLSEPAFFELLQGLGETLRVEDVQLYASHRNLHQPLPLKFHTDQAWVDIIAWRCEIPDPNGPTLLLNITDVLENFDPQEIRLLKQAVVMCPNPDNLEEQSPRPLLEFVDGCYRVYHMAFRPGVDYMSPEVFAAWKRFTTFVETEARKNSFGVTLREGECLFLHNRTMFHGRPPLSPDTPRKLKRVWLKSDLVKGAPARRDFLEL